MSGAPDAAGLVETAAEALYERLRFDDDLRTPEERLPDWGKIPEKPRDVLRDDARAVLAAVLPKIADEIRGQGSYGCELRPDGREDPQIAAWLEGIRDSYDLVRSLAEGLGQ